MPTQIDLWNRLLSVEFDKLDSVFPFSKRLARDNNWSHAIALRAIEEYRKFAYLAVVTGREVTPSDEVDQVWHLHLTYTRHYWGEFKDALGMALHHGPTAGGAREEQRYQMNYEATLLAYEAEFGTAPIDIWPSVESRFSDPLYYRRVSLKDKILLPKWVPHIAMGGPLVGGLALISSAFATSSGGEKSQGLFGIGNEILILLGAGIFMVGFISALFVMAGKGKGKSDGSAGAGVYDSGKIGDGDGGGNGCGSGCGGCGGG